MRIVDLQIDGFGIWQGLQIEGLSPQLNVIYGANEAGKTTLLHFVRSVLYGYSPNRRARYLPPFSGVRGGGTLHLDSSHGGYRVARTDTGDVPSGSLVITGPDGRRHAENLLQSLLCGMDEKTYNHVFALGLRELQELGTLSDSAAADYLYKLTTGIDRVSLTDVLRELDNSREQLLTENGRPARIDELIAQRDKLRAEVEKLGTQSRGFARLVQQRDDAQRDLDATETHLAEQRIELQRVDLALAAYDQWHQRAQLAAQLEALSGVEPPPEATLRKLDEMNQKLAARRQQLAATRRDEAQLNKPEHRIKVNEVLLRQAARIEALAEQEPWIASIETDAIEIRDRLSLLQSRLADEQKRLGNVASGSKYQFQSADDSPDTLRPLAHACRVASRKAKEARRQLHEVRQRAANVEGRIAAALGDQPEGMLTTALEKAGSLVTQLRHRVQIDDRLEDLQRQEQDLSLQTRESLEGQLLPVAPLWSLLILFALGVAMIFAAFSFDRSYIGETGLLLLFAGLAVVVVVGMRKVTMERDAERRLANCRRQAQALTAQIDKVRQERDLLDAQLPAGAGAPVARLQAAQRELATLEELVADDGRRQQLQREIQAAGRRYAEARNAYRKARRRWDEGLAALGLPKGSTPARARSLAKQQGHLGQIHQQIEQARRELDQRHRDLDQIRQRVAQVTAEAGLPPIKSTLVEHFEVIRAALEAERARLIQRNTQKQRIARLRRHASRLVQSLRWTRLRRAELIRQANASSEEELRQRQVRVEQAEALRGDIQRLTREILNILAQRGSEDDLAEWLAGDDRPGLQTRRQQTGEAIAAAEQRLKQLYEHRGQLTQELKALADDRRLPQRMLELGVVEKRLEEAVQRWQVIALTEELLETVRSRYEAQRQPETLREASLFIRKLTDGQYVRIWTPMDQDTLRVDDSQGRALSVDVLSRGTREQVFLSLRLALINLFARRGINLPVVLDDVLVNCDQRRARAAAQVLIEFAAEGHQVLSFTCHEHLFDMFRSMDVDAWRLPDARQGVAGKAMKLGFTPLPAAEPAPAPELHWVPLPPVEPGPDPDAEPYYPLATWSEAETFVPPDPPAEFVPPPDPDAEPYAPLVTWSEAEIEMPPETRPLRRTAAPRSRTVAATVERFELLPVDDLPEPPPPNLDSPLLDLVDDDAADEHWSLAEVDEAPEPEPALRLSDPPPYAHNLLFSDPPPAIASQPPIIVPVDDEFEFSPVVAAPPNVCLPATAETMASIVAAELAGPAAEDPPADQPARPWPVYRWRPGPLDHSRWQQVVVAEVPADGVEIQSPNAARPQHDEVEVFFGAERVERWADHARARSAGPKRRRRDDRNRGTG